MLIIANISIYIENTMINEKSYIWILRYKSYTKWILYTIKNISAYQQENENDNSYNKTLQWNSNSFM